MAVGSKSKFGSGGFIRLFAFIFRLDESRRARPLLENGGKGDHLRDLAGITGDGVKDFLPVLLISGVPSSFSRGKPAATCQASASG